MNTEHVHGDTMATYERTHLEDLQTKLYTWW
jgi:hypothetical protein